MACEDLDLATTLAEAIKDIDKDIIYLVPTGSKMEIAAKKLDINIVVKYLQTEIMKIMET